MKITELIKKKPAEMTDAELEKVMEWGWNPETGPTGWRAFEACWEEYVKRNKKKAVVFMKKLPEE